MKGDELNKIYNQNKTLVEEQFRIDLEKCVEKTTQEIKNDIDGDLLYQYATNSNQYVKSMNISEDCMRKTIENMKMYNGVDLFWGKMDTVDVSGHQPKLQKAYAVIYYWGSSRGMFRFLKSNYELGNKYGNRHGHRYLRNYNN